MTGSASVATGTAQVGPYEINIEDAARQAHQLRRTIYTATWTVDAATAEEQAQANQDCHATVAPSGDHATEP